MLKMDTDAQAQTEDTADSRLARTVSPDANGKIVCPDCSKYVGDAVGGEARFFCARCKISLVWNLSGVQIRLDNADLSVHLHNPDNDAQISLVIASGMQNIANYRLLLELLKARQT